MKQQTMFGVITEGDQFYFRNLEEPQHLLTAKRRRDGRWDLVKPCGSTYGPYTGEDIEGYVKHERLIRLEEPL